MEEHRAMRKILEFTKKRVLLTNVIFIAVEVYKNLLWIFPRSFVEDSLIKKVYMVYMIPVIGLGVVGYIVLLFLASVFITFEHINYQELIPGEKTKKFLIYTNVMMAESWITLIPYIGILFLLIV